MLFETTSQERAARGRAWLEALAGESRAIPRDRARDHRADHERAAVAAGRGPRRRSSRRSRRCRGAVRFASSSIGITTPGSTARCWRSATARPAPRRAAGCGGAKVVDMLKRFENIDRARHRLHGRPAYDFRWMWRELDLERPSGPALQSDSTADSWPRTRCDKLTAVSEYLTSLLRRPPVGLVGSARYRDRFVHLLRVPEADPRYPGGPDGRRIAADRRAVLHLPTGAAADPQLDDPEHAGLRRLCGDRHLPVGHPPCARALRTGAVLPLLQPAGGRQRDDRGAGGGRDHAVVAADRARSSPSSGRSGCGTTSRAGFRSTRR